jgi:hypothetical protein
MIGYIQKHDTVSWRSAINQWICELAEDANVVDEQWSNDEQLADITITEALRVSSAHSTHKRNKTAVSSLIRILHLWIEMGDRKHELQIPPG